MSKTLRDNRSVLFYGKVEKDKKRIEKEKYLDTEPIYVYSNCIEIRSSGRKVMPC